MNGTVSSLLKVIGDSPSFIRSNVSSTVKSTNNEDDRASQPIETNKKRVLQDKFEQRKLDLISKQCQTRCFLLPSPDTAILYTPSENRNDSMNPSDHST